MRLFAPQMMQIKRQLPAKSIVMTTLRLKSNEHNEIHDPLPSKSFPLWILIGFFSESELENISEV